ncbi:MAG: hypothetical protein K6V97_15405 [Actinomycetia bacterium]|nr:hypothetical protein [Actinomycetes bacterium]
MAPDTLRVEIRLPFGQGQIGGRWTPDAREREAAWDMYVELVTGTSLAELRPESSLRDAVASLSGLAVTIRRMLRRHGPAIARPKNDELTFAWVAVAMLNRVLRPFLTRWQPLLADWERRRPEGVSALEHERRWDRHEELRQGINAVREVLVAFADMLADAAGVVHLPTDRED